MSIKEYFTHLIVLVLILFAAIYGLYFLDFIGSLNFSLIILIAFIIQSTLVFFLGEKLAVSPNKNSFGQLIIGNNGFKLMISFLIIAVYMKVAAPSNKLFLVPFLLIYLGFTIFEAYFMMKQAKYKSHD